MIVGILPIIILLVLIIASLFDWKWRAVPSVLLTGALFLTLFLRANNLPFAVLGLVFAILIKDMIAMTGKEFGIADIKIMIIISLFIPTIQIFIRFMVLFVIIQFIYTIVWFKWLKRTDEMPFVPCLTIVYIVLGLVGLVI